MLGVTGETITRFDNVDINNSGDWLLELDTDAATSDDAYMLHNGAIIWKENTDMGFTAPVGKSRQSNSCGVNSHSVSMLR